MYKVQYDQSNGLHLHLHVDQRLSSLGTIKSKKLKPAVEANMKVVFVVINLQSKQSGVKNVKTIRI